MRPSFAAAVTVTLALISYTGLAPTPAQAAHAGDAYRNVDRSNDLGNDTGDSRVEGLNSSQLDQNYHGTWQMRPPAPDAPPPQTVAPIYPPPPPGAR